MQPDFVELIRSNPDFVTLEAARGGFSRILCAVMLVIYFGFILLVAFAPGVVALPIGRGLTLAFPLGVGVILSAIIITGIYVVRANGQFDRLTANIIRDIH
jgi:uncharacterized membrane protein (DUF485 family)